MIEKQNKTPTQNADIAAAAGKWESWAHPGFEESARSIARDTPIEAQVEAGQLAIEKFLESKEPTELDQHTKRGKEK